MKSQKKSPNKKELIEVKGSEKVLKHFAPQDLASLLDAAKYGALHSKCHLSKFCVGAALITCHGTLIRGCNIEFDNYSNTLHAEEVMIAHFISIGGKPYDVTAIAVYTKSKELDFPCGMCRQTLYELFGGDLIVISRNDTKYEAMLMKDLLPRGFKL